MRRLAAAPGGALQACERLISGGAEGTAEVGDFLALELAGLLGIPASVAALRIADVLNLRDRHPELWAAVTTGSSIRPWQAFKVTQACAAAGLGFEATLWVDHQFALALAVVPWGRAMRLLDGLIAKADPAVAAERAAAQREARSVSVGEHSDGGSVLYARMDTEDALALRATLDRMAETLAAGQPDPAPIGQRRATALGMLADPQAAADLLAGTGDGTPTNRHSTVIVHLSADMLVAPDADDSWTGRTHVARVPGVGALDRETLIRFLGHDRITVRPVIDLADVPAVDAYEIPERLREVIWLRNPVEVFPYSNRSAERCDLDHTVPYDHNAPPGARQTRADNLGPLGRTAHRAKTCGAWRVQQVRPGHFSWTSPTGHRYLVTPDGTHALGRAPERSQPGDSPSDETTVRASLAATLVPA